MHQLQHLMNLLNQMLAVLFALLLAQTFGEDESVPDEFLPPSYWD